MRADYYYVRLNVDGEDVPIVNHCRYATDPRCRFQVRKGGKSIPFIFSFISIFIQSE